MIHTEHPETKKFKVVVPFVLHGEETSVDQEVELTVKEAEEFATSVEAVVVK